jgi:sugar phosphate isomerase/epimerase
MPQIAVQTFTVRKHIQSAAARADTFAKLQAMGIGAIELARIDWKPQTIDSITQQINDFDITVGSTQNTFDFLKKNVDYSVKLHKQLGCRNVVVSVLPTLCILGGIERLINFSIELDHLGYLYRKQGLNLLFHHHHFEFQRYGKNTHSNGELGLDIILQHTNPENVGLVLDTYWLQRGGQCPHEKIVELADRVKVVHLRDYRIDWKFFDLLPTDTELGAGTLDFTKIVNSCQQIGVEFMAIEQDSRTPFQSLENSVKHLSSLGFSELLT